MLFSRKFKLSSRLINQRANEWNVMTKKTKQTAHQTADYRIATTKTLLACWACGVARLNPDGESFGSR